MKKKILLLVSGMFLSVSFAQDSDMAADTAKKLLEAKSAAEATEAKVSKIAEDTAKITKDATKVAEDATKVAVDAVNAMEAARVSEAKLVEEAEKAVEAKVIKDAVDTMEGAKVSEDKLVKEAIGTTEESNEKDSNVEVDSNLKEVITNSKSIEERVSLSKKKDVDLLKKLNQEALSGKSKEDFKLKPHHEKLQFECQMCHEGDDWKDYKPLVTEDCLSCHGSAEKIARRTKFMDVNYTNPHNSIHDQLDLDCQTCHNEHKPSESLCVSCHDNTKEWFKKTP